MTKFKTQQDILSYGALINDIQGFKHAGAKHSDDFNKFDTPNQLYFKPVFYFWNGDIDRPDNITQSGGLLAPTWMNYNTSNLNLQERDKGRGNINSNDFYLYNSAWAYLKLNNENERADKLQKFIELLSNINTYSPWYFQSIEGISDALSRPTNSEGMKFEDNRKKISIKCLNDSYDDRIGTLLDLYRDVTYSWINKQEIIPANLRKFDMGIYIFSSPVKNIHNPGSISKGFKESYASINPNSSQYITSYKYIEFHNCEIDYNSATTGYPNLDNIEGISPQYNIDIYFDDCYEIRYNEFMMRKIGDVIKYDIIYNSEAADSQHDDLNHEEELNRRIDIYEKTGFLGEIIGAATDRGKEYITQKFLGNIYGFSIEQSITDVNNLIKGKTGTAVKYLKKLKGSNQENFENSNIFNKNSTTQKLKYLKTIENISKSKTAINNI